MSRWTNVVVSLGLGSILTVAALAAEPTTRACGPEPVHGVQDLDLRAVWEQPAETDDYLLGRLMDARLDGEGNVCVVDFQLKNVKVFAPDGTWLRTLGGEGEGPGECQDARRLFLRPDGAYGLLQAVPGAIVWLNADGTPAGKTRVGGDATEDGAFTAAGWAIQFGEPIYAWVNQLLMDATGQHTDERIVRLEPDGALGPTLFAPPDGLSVVEDDVLQEARVYDIWEARWHPDNRGGIWVASERDRYVLQYWVVGELRREVTRAYEPVDRTDRERNALQESRRGRGWSDDRVKVGRTAPVVTAVRVADNGNLWIQLDQGGREPPEHPLAVFDVFSPEGEWLRQVRWRVEWPLGRWRIVDDRRLVMLCEDDDGEAARLVLLEIAAD